MALLESSVIRIRMLEITCTTKNGVRIRRIRGTVIRESIVLNGTVIQKLRGNQFHQVNVLLKIHYVCHICHPSTLY